MAPEEGVVPMLGPGDPAPGTDPMAPPGEPMEGDEMVAPGSGDVLPIEFVP
jgi:hypothetical protein